MKKRNRVSIFGVFSIASGAMISSGIFILPSLVYARVGPAVPAVYLLAGLFAFFGAMGVIELATAMPKAGGDYFFVRKTFGPALGTASGLLGWIALGLKSAFAIYGIAEFLSAVTGIPFQGASLSLCVLFTALNCFGLHGAARVQAVLVAALIFIMAFFSVSGTAFLASGGSLARPGALPEGMGIAGVIASTGFVFISFGGLLKVATLSEEIDRPERNIPLGMLASIAIVTLLYVAITTVVLFTLSGERFVSTVSPVSDSARTFLGAPGYWVMMIAAQLAFITTANAGIMAASRYPLALARDGLAPPALGNLAPRSGAPVVSVLLTGLFVFLALFLPLESLVKAASTVILASYVLTNLAVIVLRESGLASYRPTFRSPLYPWLQLGCAVLFSWFIVSLGSETIEITLALLLIAFCAYFFYGRKGDRGEYALLHTLRRIADRRIIGNALENELIDIVIDRDGIEQDVFDRLVRDCEILDLEYEATFERVAGKISRKLADRYGVDAELVYGEYLRRQRETNTALNEFLAIPHVAVGSGDLLFLYVVRCRKGIRFTAEQPAVKAAFFLGGSPERRDDHLKCLAAIALVAGESGFEERWMGHATAMELRNALLTSGRRRLS